MSALSHTVEERVRCLAKPVGSENVILFYVYVHLSG